METSTVPIATIHRATSESASVSLSGAKSEATSVTNSTTLSSAAIITTFVILSTTASTTATITSAMIPTTSTTMTSTMTHAMLPTTVPKEFPAVVPSVTVDDNTVNINGNTVTLTLSWGEPFNNLDPIVNYTVSCSGDITCPPNFTTTDNTTRSYTITNLTPMTNYTFSVVATNSIGSGEAGVVMITTPAGENLCSYIHKEYMYVPYTYINLLYLLCITCIHTYILATINQITIH